MQRELETEPPARRLCRGTLLSGRQFLVDIEEWGYDDARLDPTVQMTAADIAQLTRSIKQEEAARGKGCVEPGRGR
jgi:hypothetical protein